MPSCASTRAGDVATAVSDMATDGAATCIAGGTTRLDFMKANVARPSRVIAMTRVPLHRIEALETGGLRLGALVTNTDVAYHAHVETRYPRLSNAMLAGASPQLRHRATTGGHLMQRTRGDDLYDTATPGKKRAPGTGGAAIDGFNRIHAILGTSDHGIATHPSAMGVALAACV